VKDVSISVLGKEINTASNYLGYFQVTVDTSDYLILEKTFYVSGLVKISNNQGMTILVNKRGKAEYEGGFEEFNIFFMENITYPYQARINNTQGGVFVSFDVDSLGQVNNISIIKDIGNGCGDEVVKVLGNLPNMWFPSESETVFILPVTFQLGNSKIKKIDIELPTGILLEELFVTAVGIN